MLNFDQYRETESTTLAAALAADLAEAEAAVAASGDGWAIQRDGTITDWTHRLPRPVRPTGTSTLVDPESFGAYVSRLAVEETTVWADRSSARFEAVFNDHPAATLGATAEEADAGWRDHSASLFLTQSEDWRAWIERDGSSMPQKQFGEFVENMAHTIISPDSATMLEVATTLTMKRSLDFDSRVRLDNGDTAFKFVEESSMRAGRGASGVEIPSVFVFETPIWDGTAPVQVTARLRVRASGDGVTMGYKLLRVADATRDAFEAVVELVGRHLPNGMPIFLGVPRPDRLMR